MAFSIPMNDTYTSKADASSLKGDLKGLHSLVAKMRSNGQVDDAFTLLFKSLQALQDENNLKALRLAKLLKEKFGKRGEKLDRAQLELFIHSMKNENGAADEDTPLPPLPPLPPPPPDPPPKKRKRTGRNPLPDNIIREKLRIEPAPEDQVCAQCGAHKHIIGVETSELLEFVPAHFKLLEIERVKMACKPCQGEVVIAPVADKPIEGGRPGPGLLAHIVVSKFDDHLPLYRLSRFYQRHGVSIPDSTLGTWVASVANAFEPIYSQIASGVLRSYVLGVDDTSLKVLDRSHPAGIRRGHMWAYVGYDEGIPVRVVYRFTPTWEKEGPCAFLKDREGYIQGDGYPGIECLFPGAQKTRVKVGCMAHVRRKYKEALDAQDLRAAEPLGLIGNLYACEKLATSRKATPMERLALRQKYAVPAMQALKQWVARNQAWIEPKSLLAKAVTYTVNQWDSLQVYLSDGAIPIDNNRVEQRMRPVAVGRKNYLFAGSDAGASRAAILYTIIAGCHLSGVNPFDYVRDVLERLSAGWPQSRLTELLPENWKPLPAESQELVCDQTRRRSTGSGAFAVCPPHPMTP